MRIVLILTAVLTTFGATAALARDLPALGTREDLRDAIYAQDTQRVEDMFAILDAMILWDHAKHWHMRYMFEVFQTTHPDIVRFAQKWQQERHRTGYAETALSMMYRIAGNNTRGYKFNSDTYPDALHEGYRYLNESFRLARNAYSMNPGLAPASDAVFAVARSTEALSYALKIGEEVMQNRPDWQSLSLLLNVSNPSYGGSFDLGAALCDFFGPDLSDPHEDMVRWCKIHLATLFYWRELEADYFAWMAEEDKPFPEYHWVRLFIARDADQKTSPEDLDRAERFFRDGTTTDFRLANRYDMHVSGPLKRPPMEQLVLTRAKTRAREILEHDPYNLWALDTLRQLSLEPERQPDGSYIFWNKNLGPSKEESAEYARLRLLTAPYNPQFWSDYAFDLRLLEDRYQDPARAFTAGDRAQINAVIYSNYGHWHMARHFQTKFGQIEQYQRLIDEGFFTAEALAQNGFDLDADVICPMLRTRRIMDIISQAEHGEDARFRSAIIAAAYQTVRDDVEAEGRCPGILKGPEEALWFQPVALSHVAHRTSFHISE